MTAGRQRDTTAAVVVVFRDDLRLADHPALQQAVAGGAPIIPLFVADPKQLPAGRAGRWWLHQALVGLDRGLRRCGSRLLVRQGDLVSEIERLLQEVPIAGLFLNSRRHDDPLIGRLRSAVGSTLLREPGRSAIDRLVDAAALPKESPFEQFAQSLRQGLRELEPLAPPMVIRCGVGDLASVTIASLALVTDGDLEQALRQHWQPDLVLAERLLHSFCHHRLRRHVEAAEQPSLAATSRLSPYLRWGQLSVAQLAQAVRHSGQAAGGWLDALLRREFALFQADHFPRLVSAPLEPRFDRFPWRNDPIEFEVWCFGETGIPFVDAGLRELQATGSMAQPARQAAALFLCKYLLIDWRRGASHFLDWLVDGDERINAANWQWQVGSGVDAEPFVRVQSPVAIAERADPHGAYVRHWLPGLHDLPEEWIQRPWEAPAEVLARAGLVLGSDYPLPIVDLKASRNRALELWSRL